MKHYLIFAVTAATLLLTGCGAAEKPTETTQDYFVSLAESAALAETSATTVPETNYSLVRDYTVKEMFATLTLEGQQVGFPINTETANGFIQTDKTLTTPSGRVLVSINDDSMKSLSVDFAGEGNSLCGISVGDSSDDVRTKIGIADFITGDVLSLDEEASGSYTFLGAGTEQVVYYVKSGRVSGFRLIV